MMAAYTSLSEKSRVAGAGSRRAMRKSACRFGSVKGEGTRWQKEGRCVGTSMYRFDGS